MKKTVELSVDTSNMIDMFGIGVYVILDNDSLGIVVSNGGNVLDATSYTYEELKIEVKDSQGGDT
tara:strand:+ start:1570 stop:1764 length:195 start_codon:yes stop_codon:yes gene_type:complete